MKKKTKKKLIIAVTSTTFIVAFVLISQGFWAHRKGFFEPTYSKVDICSIISKSELTADEYKIVFTQTGLGKSAIDYLLQKGAEGRQEIMNYQNAFFEPKEVKCAPMLGWFTREDMLVDENDERTYGPKFVSVQPGDIVITLATHSLGWNHGHAGIVIDEGTTLESRVLGQNSTVADLDFWRSYANYIVLRVKDVSAQFTQAVVTFAREYLFDTPYRLTAGLIGDKVIPQESASFGLQCAYLVWYAWQNAGIDLDSDGGRLVSPLDILLSDNVEVVQMYGVDPNIFVK